MANGNERLSYKDIEDKFKELMVEYAIVTVPPEEINMDEKIENTFVNSILFIKIVVALETEFQFEFEDEDLNADSYTTLHDIVRYVENKIKSKGTL
ncbi:acyl carrier protein [Alkaliphilus peptidifermentans]|uniref:Acyl carrier protein n=1 Tax=Alkaliphilus peptidifermentans DSM 18978 TaxID=1120976 RepID=A0A1G5K7Q5_9FIRM|nr:phosphopantetheine-binding protein [Alkaliphilus peptidifermentans]SCY96038.1 acyl carrier protein [Alkaliphilus peptidifermentans DSM 18978]